MKRIEITELYTVIMDELTKIISNAFKTIHISRSDIKRVNGIVNKNMLLRGLILIELKDNMYIIVKYDDKEEIEEGYLLNKIEVLESSGKNKIITRNDLLDKECGERFEGSVSEGIPFGFGLLFDDDGNRVYEGIVINWNRMGYGVSFNESGFKEYEGYWYNDLRFGSGRSFDIEGNIIYDGLWLNGQQLEYDYEGDGSNLNIYVKHLKLVDNCILMCFDVSRFSLLEELIIGNECFENVDFFRIDGLNHLKSIKIGRNSFTKYKNDSRINRSRSFHVLNCVELELIVIGEFSFSDYSGGFELKNLPSLCIIRIGSVNTESYNFCHSSFILQDLPNLQSIELGVNAFSLPLSTVISNLPSLKSITLGLSALYGKLDVLCSLEMKDLPQLEEIISAYGSFFFTHSLTLSNIPNLKIVNLPGAFSKVQTKSISNVSHILAELISFTEYDINPHFTTLPISNGSWNKLHSFSLRNRGMLESIEIGDDCFANVKTFMIDGLNHLKRITIGTKSFTNQKDNWNTINMSVLYSFHLLNCANLESIEIGRFSFSGYGGKFELKNLPSLSSIKIGENDTDYSESNYFGQSFNFCFSPSFILQDLPNLQYVELGNVAFHDSVSTVISNLPSLKCTKLGITALMGVHNNDSCSLEMKDLPQLEEITSVTGSFEYPLSVTLSNIPNLKIVRLPRAFGNVITKSISNVSSLLANIVKVM